MTEADIRNELIRQLSSSSAGTDAAFMSELFLDRFSRRADLVVANGKLAVYEIKTAMDTLERLDGQLETYQQFFEQVTVVCAPKHLRAVEARVSPSIGVWSIDAGAITPIRNAKTQKPVSKANWLSFLPVDELRAFLKTQELPRTGDRSRLVEVAEKAHLAAVRSYVLAYFKRRVQRIEQRLKIKAAAHSAIRSMPQELHTEKLNAFLSNLKHAQSTAIPRRIG